MRYLKVRSAQHKSAKLRQIAPAIRSFDQISQPYCCSPKKTAKGSAALRHGAACMKTSEARICFVVPCNRYLNSRPRRSAKRQSAMRVGIRQIARNNRAIDRQQQRLHRLPLGWARGPDHLDAILRRISRKIANSGLVPQAAMPSCASDSIYCQYRRLALNAARIQFIIQTASGALLGEIERLWRGCNAAPNIALRHAVQSAVFSKIYDAKACAFSNFCRVNA